MEPPGSDDDQKKYVQLPSTKADEHNLVAYNLGQDERLEAVKREAASQQYMKAIHPNKFNRDMKNKQIRAGCETAE